MHNHTVAGNDDLPQFDVKTENELLKLRLKAEFGAECSMNGGKVPEEVINEFLHAVYAFEQQLRLSKPPVSIYEKIGKPEIISAESLNDENLSRELKRLHDCMRQHHLQLDVLGRYPDRIIYRFITEEFIYLEMEDVHLPGFIHHFCYEDFHPDHEVSIREKVVEFLSIWFNGKDAKENELFGSGDDEMDDAPISKESMIIDMRKYMSPYKRFQNCEYRINQVEYKWMELADRGIGLALGHLRYDGEDENGNIKHVEGEMRFELNNLGTHWYVVCFEIPDGTKGER